VVQGILCHHNAAFDARTTPPAHVMSPVDRDEFRMTAGMRLLLAAATLVITRLDPSEPSHFAAATYDILVGYVGYAAYRHLKDK
jgi:hypothetical protein